MDFKDKILKIVKKYEDVFKEMSTFIYYHPELKFEEHESYKYYVQKAQEFGFEVNTDIPNLPTAFVASFGSDENRHIGFLGEYDALPGLYQVPNIDFKDNDGKAVGHGCGHNLLGVGSFISAVILKELIETENLPLKVSFYGCPGEESGSGKAFMVRDGVFDDLDLAYCWHPSPSNSIMNKTTLANILVDFHFKGVSSHAANSPELGRSALDAVELMNVGVNYLREHVPSTSRIHYAVTNSGGILPSVVQAEATVKYTIRDLTARDVFDIYERVQKIAKGASLMTETEVEIDFIKGCSNYIGNRPMERVLHDSLKKMYDLEVTPEMNEYAEKIYNSFTDNERRAKLLTMTSLGFMDDPKYLEGKFIYDRVSPYEESDEVFSGSTDVADVSWVVPTAQLSAATSAIGTPLHTWQMTAQGLSELAFNGMFNAGTSMADAALQTALNEELYREAVEAFNNFRNDNEYVCPVTDDATPR